jgi:predicted nuclease with TOPRIM domain
MKVKDSEGNIIPNMSKENGAVIFTSKDEYHKRLAQIKQRKRLDELECENKRLEEKLDSVELKLDKLLSLFQEK